MTTITRQIAMSNQTCIVCDIAFMVPTDWERWRKRDGATFYCPNGHGQCYPKRDEAAELRKQLEQRDRDLSAAQNRATHLEDQRAAAERSNSALRGVITRTKKRAQTGQCPVCPRSFANLAAHMGAQHPDWAGTDALHEPTAEQLEADRG